MRDADFDFLESIVRLGGCALVFDIDELSGYGRTYFANRSADMLKAGWVSHRSPWWLITERGKIAYAIETGRRTRARATRKTGANRLQLNNFQPSV